VQATDVVKESYATAAKGATEFNLKFMEIARTNTNTAFEYAQELMRMKSPSSRCRRNMRASSSTR